MVPAKKTTQNKTKSREKSIIPWLKVNVGMHKDPDWRGKNAAAKYTVNYFSMTVLNLSAEVIWWIYK